MEILILLLLLQIKHCYADFVLQTYMQTVKKGIWLHPVGISHSLEHMYCSIIVIFLFSFFFTISLPKILVITFFEFMVHYLLDYFKVKHGTKDNKTPKYWTQFGVDQFAHQLTYIFMVWYLIV